MIFIIGGSGEDKIKFCNERFNPKDGEVLENLYEFLKKAYEKYSEEEILKNLFKFKIIIADEIGCGIVPMNKNDRLFRDFYGSICCKVAERADVVIRIICGIEQTLKL